MGWGDLINIGGQAVGLYGKKREGDEAEKLAKKRAKAEKKAAKANKEISLYDASVAAKDAFAFEQSSADKLAVHMAQVDRVLGTTTARLGKSGVAVSAGSALQVQERVINEGMRDAEILQHNGRTGYERRMSHARRYELLAEKDLRDAAATASIIEDAGRSEQIGHYWRAAGRGVGLFDSIGQSEGWW